MSVLKTERGSRNLDLISRAQSGDEDDSMLALECIIEENIFII